VIVKNALGAGTTGAAGVRLAEVPAPKATEGMIALAGSGVRHSAAKARAIGPPANAARCPGGANLADHARQAMTAVRANAADPVNAARLLRRCRK
jgi:hypothetical protein